MIKFDFCEIKEPFEFIKKLMPDASDEELREAQFNYCQFLNELFKIYLKNNNIE